MSDLTIVFPTFTVHTRNGNVEFTSAFLTFKEARDYLAGLDPLASLSPRSRNSFVDDLLSRPTLSQLQVAWVHKLATDAKAQKEKEATLAVTAKPVIDLMRVASAAGKAFPRIVFRGLKLAYFSERDVVTVKEGPVFMGRILSSGRVDLKVYADRIVLDRIMELAADPAKVLAQNGIATGQCCLCGRPLSTRESRSAGYGPICAEQHGLPWGDTTAADAADAAAKSEVQS